MKRLLWLAAALLACVGCKSAPVEQRVQDFKDAVAQFEKEFSEGIVAVRQDAALTAGQQTEAITKLQEEIGEKARDLCLKTIRKNKDNEAGLEAFKYGVFLFTPEEQEKVLASLGDKVREDSFVQQVTRTLAAKKATQAGQQFIDFTVVQDPDNEAESTVRFSDYVGKGKYVLVDFWASWCGPCKAEIPNIRAVYDKYAGEDFDVLSVAVWDKPAATAKAAAELGITWNQIVNAQQIPTDLYGIEGIPHVMLVGPDGVILDRDLRGDGIEANVSRYVKAKK